MRGKSFIVVSLTPVQSDFLVSLGWIIGHGGEECSTPLHVSPITGMAGMFLKAWHWQTPLFISNRFRARSLLPLIWKEASDVFPQLNPDMKGGHVYDRCVLRFALDSIFLPEATSDFSAADVGGEEEEEGEREECWKDHHPSFGKLPVEHSGSWLTLVSVYLECAFPAWL